MSWPTSAEINEAVQNPQLSFQDPDLAGGTAEIDGMGIPLARSGSNADVYCFTCGADKVAVKCFTRQIAHLEHRYEAIHTALSSLRLPFTVDCAYQAKGIWLQEKWYPLVRMQWVDGIRLNEFAKSIAGRKEMLNALIQILSKMGDWLEANHLGHCDLQHGNILLIPSQGGKKLALRLVDYDGMWVPALDGDPPGEFGHPDYQHPTRASKGYYGPAADRFSLLAIATGLRGLMALGAEAWARYDNTVNMLFTQQDYAAPSRSPLFAELGRSKDDVVRRLVEALGEACTCSLDRVRPLSEVLSGKPVVDPGYEIVAEEVEVLPLMDDDELASRPADEYSKLVIPALVETDDGHRQSRKRRLREHESEESVSRKKWLLAGAPWLVMLILVILWAAGAFRGKTPKDLPGRTGEVAQNQSKEDSTESHEDKKTTNIGEIAIGEQAVGSVCKFEIAPGVFMEFCWIPSGEIQLGSPKAEQDYITKNFFEGKQPEFLDAENESRRGKQKFAGFWLGKYTVTQAEWKTVMGNNPSDFQPGGNKQLGGGVNTSRFPVERVSWEHCQRFLERINKRDVEKVFGKGASFKLPHEDQWEYACRGGRGNQQAFFFGNVLNGTQANCKGNFPYGTAIKDQYLGQTCAVDFTNGGKYTEHPWGLFHMCGNVWQWCDNSHAQSNKKVTRGGAWDSIAWHCRSACRDGRAPDFQCNYIGFRVSVSMDNDLTSTRQPDHNEQDWVPLFNKNDLTGWEQSNSPSVDWKNIDGIVSGVNRASKQGTGGSLITSRKDYFDFHFHCNVYLDKLPSGAGLGLRNSFWHVIWRRGFS